ncbi:PROTEIN PLANT CADMIUM RESISTANCE 4-RELATED [Salix purpurea]|uniref:PROTEIN PLANT CADMIUM RESISTANCE 4-RELATED n=1 Tax=Salix purpurea TaxID=77065 RepID=A0A9Q0ZWE6_SALPP|nr:PROTEIN PLANT CADMIUM RESISTANCE 4-RELATED [Salix purpurea]
MGRPEADSSSYDESVQPQEDQYEQTQGDFSAHAYETSYDDPGQSQYGGQPAQPSQFPPQGPQTNPMYSTGPSPPAPYPPRGQQKFQNQPAQFPPQNPMKPAAYPPQGPQMSPMYNNGPNQPANFPQRGPQPMPQAFPPQAFQNPYQAQPQGGQFPPKSPVNGIPVAPLNQQQQAWTTGIFDCLEDPSNALITALFPCVTFGQIAEIVDNGQSTCATNGMMYGLVASCFGMPCLLSCGYRSKLRAKYGLIEDPAPDWLTHCIFEWCALCQEYRELNNRGLDPSIGWQGNISRQNLQQADAGMAPPTNQRMMP